MAQESAGGENPKKSYAALARDFVSTWGRFIDQRTAKSYVDNLEYTGERCGCNAVISEAVEERILKVFRTVRSSGACVVRNTLASIARVTVKNYNRTSKEKKLDFASSQSWLTGFIERHDLHFRRSTTNRTVTAVEIMKEGELFYSNLQEYRVKNAVAKELVFNVDEFFVHNLACGGDRTWTETQGDQTTVVVKESKVGFTCSVTSCADGSAPIIQFIFKGTTDRVHAKIIPNGLRRSTC